MPFPLATSISSFLQEGGEEERDGHVGDLAMIMFLFNTSWGKMAHVCVILDPLHICRLESISFLFQEDP